MNIFFNILVFFIISPAMASTSRDLLHEIYTLQKNHAGLLPYKQKVFGYDLQKNYLSTQSSLTDTDEEFDRILIQKFHRNLGDQHSGFFVDENCKKVSVHLPFAMAEIENQVRVYWVNQKIESPVRKGDLVLLINKENAVLHLSRRYLPNTGYPDKQKMKQGWRFSKRINECENRFLQPLEMTIQRGEQVLSFSIPWLTLPSNTNKDINLSRPPLSEANDFSLPTTEQNFFTDQLPARGDNGQKLSYRAPFSQHILWENEPTNRFHSYTFLSKTQLKKFGYLRIHTFNIQSDEEYYAGHENWASDLRKSLEKVADTDGLILDMTANSGGMINLFKYLAASLVHEPVIMPQTQFVTKSLSQWSVNPCNNYELSKALQNSLDSESLNPLFRKFLSPYEPTQENWFEMKRQCALQKYALSSEEFFMLGTPRAIETIYPTSPIRYLKPVIVILDHSSFSATEMAAYLLKQSPNITLFGEASGGGMSYTLFHPLKSNPHRVTGVSYSPGLSFDEKHLPLEDIGMIPQIPYAIGWSDFENDFKDFNLQVLNVLEKLTDERAKPNQSPR